MTRPPAPSPQPPMDPGLEHTPAHGIATPEYVKNKVRAAEKRGQKNATLAGLASAGAVLVAGIGVTFGVFFQLEKRAAEMDSVILEKADSGAKQMVNELKTDIALMKRDVEDLKKAAKKDEEVSAEILRVVKRRDGGR